MKLKTKLIPLAGAAAVCATVAPITLTACGSTSVGKTIDISNGYAPSGVQHKFDYLTYKQAIDEYREEIEDNKDVFGQDFIWSKSKYLDVLKSQSGGVYNGMSASANIQADITLNSLKVNKAQKTILTINTPDKNTSAVFEYELPTISFDYEYKIVIELPVSDQLAIGNLDKNKQKQTVIGHITFDNVPYAPMPSRINDRDFGLMKPEDDPYAEMFSTYWCIQPVLQWMLSPVESADSYHFDKYPAAWSVTYDVELDETRTVEIGGISREITEVTEKNGTFLSSNMQQWWRDVENETIFLMLTKPDGYIRSIMHMSGEANKSMEILATLVGGSAHSWYLQPVGWDSTDSPL